MRNLSKNKTAVERKRVERDEEKNRRPIAFFFVPNRRGKQLSTFGLCERRDHMLSRVEEGDHLGSFGVGYVATQSRIYRIGGDIIDFKKGDEFPKDVFYCDFSYGGEEEDGGIVCGRWEKGPSMSGCKPNPLLQVVNGKIYALGGTSSVFSYWIDEDEDEDEDEEKIYALGGTSSVLSYWFDGVKEDEDEDEDEDEEDEEVYLGKKQYVGVRDPMFEVLDPLTDKWETLPQPPFRFMYRSNGAKIKWHTVIGNVIYMHVVGYCKDVVKLQTLYSFDTATKKWKAHGPNPSPANKNDELFREKMRQIMGVSSRALVVGNRFYWFSFTSVGGCCMSRDRIFAIDLNDSLNNTFSPVRGLAHVTNPVDCNTAQGFLTHLGENRFYLVIFFFSGIKLYARTCTFELLERGQQRRIKHARCWQPIFTTEIMSLMNP